MQSKHAQDSQSDEDRITIGVAATILGVHPQTLRDYEAKGLITSTRTPGGNRRFRRGDVVALRDNGTALAAGAAS